MNKDGDTLVEPIHPFIDTICQLYVHGYAYWMNQSNEYGLVIDGQRIYRKSYLLTSQKHKNSQEIARGRFSVIYKPIQSLFTQQNNVYKVIHLKTCSKHYLRCAIREMIYYNQFKHPHLFKPFDSQLVLSNGYFDSIVYSLPYRPTTLDKVNLGRTLLTKLKLVKQVALGLEYMHGLEVVHGDIKPSNVILDQEGRYAWLNDFNVSKFVEVGEENPQSSYYYRPPECFAKEPYTKSSDLYSLGLLILDLVFQQSCYVKSLLALYNVTEPGENWHIGVDRSDKVASKLDIVDHVKSLLKSSKLSEIEQEMLAFVTDTLLQSDMSKRGVIGDLIKHLKTWIEKETKNELEKPDPDKVVRFGVMNMVPLHSSTLFDMGKQVETKLDIVEPWSTVANNFIKSEYREQMGRPLTSELMRKTIQEWSFTILRYLDVQGLSVDNAIIEDVVRLCVQTCGFVFEDFDIGQDKLFPSVIFLVLFMNGFQLS